MIVGLMTTASARSLNAVSDRAEIASEFRLAVGVLYNLGILEGFGDGTFRPEATVTRAQMTNLIYDMMIGPVTAPPLLATEFTDVYPGSGAYWARGYIAWAHGQGIVVGTGGGRFEPNRPVTIVEAATMLLRALGYGRMGEFQGTGWAQRASNEALQRGIFNADITETNIMQGAQRQVAAQMVFNTMFANRVQFINAQEVYLPLSGRFGDRFGLPATPGQLVRVNSAPVIVGQAANPVPFFNLDGTPAGLGTLTFPVTGHEVGRVVNVYAFNGQVFFMDVISTDINVAAGTGDVARLGQLGITNANNMAPTNRGRSIMVVEDGVLTPNRRVAVDPIDGAISTVQGAVALNLLNHSDQTWVLYGGTLRTVIYATRTVENVHRIGNDVIFGAETSVPAFTVPANRVHLQGGLTWPMLTQSNLTGDPDAATNGNIFGLWANVSREIRSGVVHFVLTPVETITGAVVEMASGNAAVTQIRFAGSTTFLNYVPGYMVDRGQFSTRIDSLNDNAFASFLAAGLPDRNTQLWTAYISGVTGHVIAVERFVPVFGDNAELAMLVEAGWDYTNNVGTATFVRADGTRVTRAAALPLLPVLPPGEVYTEAQLLAALLAMTGRVVWTAEFNGVNYMTLLTWNNRGSNAVQISPAGLAGGNEVPAGFTSWAIFFNNPSQAPIFTPLFDAANLTTQVRTLTPETRFITSSGATSMFPNQPEGQLPHAGFLDVVYLLDGATLERVPTVFVVTVAGGQGPLAEIPFPPAPGPEINVESATVAWADWFPVAPATTSTIELEVDVTLIPDGTPLGVELFALPFTASYDPPAGVAAAVSAIVDGVATVTLTVTTPPATAGQFLVRVGGGGAVGEGTVTLTPAAPAIVSVANGAGGTAGVVPQTVFMNIVTFDVPDGTVLNLTWDPAVVAGANLPATITVVNNQALIQVVLTNTFTVQTPVTLTVTGSVPAAQSGLAVATPLTGTATLTLG